MKDNIPWWTKNNLLFQDHLLCTLTPSPVSLNTFNSSRTLPPSLSLRSFSCSCQFNPLCRLCSTAIVITIISFFSHWCCCLHCFHTLSSAISHILFWPQNRTEPQHNANNNNNNNNSVMQFSPILQSRITYTFYCRTPPPATAVAHSGC